MPRISNPTTGTGDDGTTATSNGKRVPKDAPNIRTLGEIDELNSVIGLTLSHHTISAKVVESLRFVQNDLFHLGAEINALDTPDEITAHPCIEEHHVKHLEDTIAELYNWSHYATSPFPEALQQQPPYILPAQSAAELNVRL